MQDQINSLESLFEKTTDYLEKRIELVKLQAVHKAADVASTFLSRVIIATIVLLMVLVLNTGVAIWLGELLGEMYYGFFVLAGFYLLLAIVLYACRRTWLKRPFSDMIIKKMLN